MARLVPAVVMLLALCAAAMGQTLTAKEKADRKYLLARAQAWVDTWNKGDVKRMRQLHGPDLDKQFYGIGGTFTPVKKLLEEIEKTNFWGVKWAIKIQDPHIRLMGANSALVIFRLVGKETNSKGVVKDFAEGFTLAYQRLKGDWKIVHVHDSSKL